MSRYPYTPGFAQGSDTSEEAAALVDHITLRERVLNCLAAAAPDGLTYDEIQVELDVIQSTISARVRELLLLGKIKDSGERRLTRYKRKARVYVLGAGPEALPPKDDSPFDLLEDYTSVFYNEFEDEEDCG